MFPIPAAAEPLVQAIRGAFTQPTFERFIALMSGLIVTMGRRTVSRALRLAWPLLEGHFSDWHRLYSQAHFSMWQLGLALAQQVVSLLPADAPIILIADDTVDEKQGDHVWCKGAHRDPTRSTRSSGKVAIRFGHKWLVMGVLVRLPATSRPWALPILAGLCASEKAASKARPRYRHKTPGQLSLQLLIRLMRWFPKRKFILLADARAASHTLAAFASTHRDRVTLISRMRADANLYDPPKNPKQRTRGGSYAKKGRKQSAPRDRLGQLPRHLKEVNWYGSSRRRVAYVSDSGLWYGKHDRRHRVVPIRWVCVLGNKRQHRDDAYFYSTDPQMDASRIIELYAMRWNIEVTFQEARAWMGLETTRHWCHQSVLRVVPILLGLFSAVGLMWQRLCQNDPQVRSGAIQFSCTPCYQKQPGAITFADALSAVRRALWQTTLLGHRDLDQCLIHLPHPLQELIFQQLCAAA
jgi:hypothetical protein